MSELVAAARSKGEVLVFKRGALREQQKDAIVSDEEHHVQPGRCSDLEKEKGSVQANVEKQTSILHWQNVSYIVKTGGGERLILDNVDGWVKPGTLTALMGVSGVSGGFSSDCSSCIANTRPRFSTCSRVVSPWAL